MELIDRFNERFNTNYDKPKNVKYEANEFYKLPKTGMKQELQSMTSDQLEELKIGLVDISKDIKTQIKASEAYIQRRSSEWYVDASYVLRKVTMALALLQLEQSHRNKEKLAKQQSIFEYNFVDIAKIMLDDNTFNKIRERAIQLSEK